MKNIVINLKRRLDRKQNIQKLFGDILDYSFYEAVDGKALIETLDLYKLFLNNDFAWRRGVIGCALSHYDLWNQLIQDKYDNYCIFEDDITLSQNFSQEKLNQCHKFVNDNHIDILFLGFSMNKILREEYKNIYNSGELSFHEYNSQLYIGGFFGYIISKNGALKMQKYISENGIKHGIDYLIKINKKLKVWECRPFLVHSDWFDNPMSNVDTDIQNDTNRLDFSGYNEILKNEFEIVEINGYKYKYYGGLDSTGNDYTRIQTRDISHIEKYARSNDNCVCFNTLGFLKNRFNDLTRSNWFHPQNDGLYVKIDGEKYTSLVQNKKNIRVKMLCNWCSSYQLCQEWNHMSKGDFKWNNIEIVSDNRADYFVIINKPLHENEFYIPEKTIIFHMEPWCYDLKQNWGVKTWGSWSKPDENKFLQVRSHDKYLNNAFWQLRMTYTELKEELIMKNKGNLISSICSSKYFDPGHIKRIDFLKYVEQQNDPDVRIDIYNHDNTHNFQNYKGPHPVGNKDIGIKPYKYYFMGENNSEKNFITEKIWEPLLTETLCFYWGCPNVSEYIHPDAYVILDLDNFEKSFQIIKESIQNNLWEKRLNIIRAEKQKVLEYYSFFPTIERIFKENPGNKYFSFVQDVKNICFIHSCNLPNVGTEVLDSLILQIKTSGLIDSLDYIIINNIGNPIDKTYGEKIHIINYSANVKLFEIPTIRLISDFASQFRDVKLLYMHTKGISYTKNTQNKNVIDWTNYMSYFMIDKYEDCLEKLNQYDAVGCNYLTAPRKHFSGNFWWANTNYIQNISTGELQERHDAEWWILSQTDNFQSIHNSNINHYLEPYPENNYK